MIVYLASNNPHKIVELAALGKPDYLDLRSAREIGGMPQVVEDTGQFSGNALKKAAALAVQAPDAWILSDDTGLCVDVLDGAPGVETAYFAGPHATYVENREKLLRVMQGQPDRSAVFACVLCLLIQSKAHYFIGTCPGQILNEPRGSSGFGYDPIFAPQGHAQSFAEMGRSEEH